MLAYYETTSRNMTKPCGYDVCKTESIVLGFYIILGLGCCGEQGQRGKVEGEVHRLIAALD
jgi:hypothetical protein